MTKTEALTVLCGRVSFTDEGERDAVLAALTKVEAKPKAKAAGKSKRK